MVKGIKTSFIFTVIFLFIGIGFAAAQDIIVLKNGEMIEAKVEEISPTEIRYKRFDHLDGPTIVILTVDVLSIRYENGRTEIINTVTQPTTTTPNDSTQQTMVQAANHLDRNPRFNTLGLTLGYLGVSNFGFSLKGTVSPAPYTFFDFNAGLGFERFSFNGNVNFNGFVPFRNGGWYGGLGLGGGVYELADSMNGYFAINAITGFLFFNWLNITVTLEMEVVPEFDIRFKPMVGYVYRFKSPQNTDTKVDPSSQYFPYLQAVSDNMVLINGGTFMMGSPANELRRGYDENQHQVTVSSFYIGKYLVTQAEYQAVMGTNPSRFKGINLPVERITWYDAIEYCNRLSQREGLTPAYTRNGNNVTWNHNANGYRLPTEAEWEYACRAGTTTAYNTGAAINDNTGWYSANSGRKTHPVGQKSANAWDLYDMHGNVWEWCWDWYDAYPSGAQIDPTGAVSGTFRVIRGGSWDDGGQDARSAFRDNCNPNLRIYSNGFRLVRP